jgi:CheY-like chemotaxis protein
MPYALIVVGRALKPEQGRRAPIAAMLNVTAGRSLMAVILIVEDDFFIRKIAEMTIQDWGHQTFAAGDVEEALSYLRSDEHIDALFTDIYLNTSMHGGCDLAQKAIELRPNLRVLYTTGNFINDEMKALFVADTQCLRKPYTDDQLQNCFTVLLAA